MSKPRKPGTLPAPKSDAEQKASAAELDRYRTEILNASASELDREDQAELLRMLREAAANGVF